MVMPKIRKVILLIGTSRAYGRGLVRGIAKYSRLQGPWRFLKKPLFYRESSELEKVLPRLKKWGADGIIGRIARKHERIIEMGLPIVSVDDEELIPGLYRIVADYTKTGKMAAEHLLDRGFRRFAYCGFEDMKWSNEYLKSFHERIAESGFEIHVYKQPRLKRQRLWENEQVLMADWLKSLSKPMGLMACNDDRAQQVIEACEIAGLHVPEEISIIGVDNDDMVCDLTNPPLSSIAVNTERVGYEAAELLDKLMSGVKIPEHKIILRPTHIVTRQSTNILAIEDAEVGCALRFIRQHPKEAIQVSDVADATTLSRRCLERRFRKSLGRSILHEIRCVRVEQIVQMLINTNLPVSQIALALGYTSTDHIARYFQREKGMSPQNYRKQYGSKYTVYY